MVEKKKYLPNKNPVIDLLKFFSEQIRRIKPQKRSLLTESKLNDIFYDIYVYLYKMCCVTSNLKSTYFKLVVY